MQCLSNTKPLKQYILSGLYLSHLKTEGALLRVFAQVIEQLWSQKTHKVTKIKELKSQIQKFDRTFRGKSQHDAQELLRRLIEGLSADITDHSTCVYYSILFSSAF